MVIVSDTIQTSSGTTTSVRWGSAVTSSSAVSWVTAAGSVGSKSVVQQNVVGGTVTTAVTPSGSLVRQSVSVVIDRAHLAGASVRGLRRLVTSAVGLVPSRGDTVSLVLARFAKPAVARTAAPTIVSTLLPDAVPAIWILGGLIAVVVLALALACGARSRTRAGVVRR